MKEFLFFLPFYTVAFVAWFALRYPAWLAGGAVAAVLLIILLFRPLEHGGGRESVLGGASRIARSLIVDEGTVPQGQ